MKTIINNGYRVSSEYVGLLCSLLRNDYKINWNNFKEEDMFYDEFSNEFEVINVNHEDKSITIVR